VDIAPADQTAVEAMWASYVADSGYDGSLVTAFAFGDCAELADELGLLVLHGPKRATAGLVRPRPSPWWRRYPGFCAAPRRPLTRPARIVAAPWAGHLAGALERVVLHALTGQDVDQFPRRGRTNASRRDAGPGRRCRPTTPR
jgi:hypothetical protein